MSVVALVVVEIAELVRPDSLKTHKNDGADDIASGGYECISGDGGGGSGGGSGGGGAGGAPDNRLVKEVVVVGAVVATAAPTAIGSLFENHF